MWESFGMIVAFAYDGFLCTYIKIYVCLGMLTIGILCYGVVEVWHRREKSREMLDKSRTAAENGAVLEPLPVD
jgi:hypothetical protein